MPAHLYYLVSSLPMLRFGERPQLTPEALQAQASHWITKEQLDTLQQLSLLPNPCLPGLPPPTHLYFAWETALRNRLAKSRGHQSGTDPVLFLQPELAAFPETERYVQEALNASNPLEKERILDQARWAAIENFHSSSSFSFAVICAYQLKLQIASKWLPRTPENGRVALDLAFTQVASSLNNIFHKSPTR